MVAIFAIALLYLAMVAFYESDDKRASFDLMKKSAYARRAGFAGGWGAALAALFTFSTLQGWERGVPLWFGAFSAVAAACLLVTALAPRRQRLNAIGAIVAALGAGLILAIQSIA